MARVKESRKRIAVFLLLTGAISSVLYYRIITGGGIDGAGGAYTQYLMWAPGVSALITRLIFQRNLRGFGWKPRNFGAHALAYAFPLLYGAVIYGLVWLAFALTGHFLDLHVWSPRQLAPPATREPLIHILTATG